MGISFDITAEYFKNGILAAGKGVKKKSVISSGKNSSVVRGVCHLMSIVHLHLLAFYSHLDISHIFVASFTLPKK